MKIELEVDGVTFIGELKSSTNPKTVKALESAIPISGKPMKWGDELYFDAGINVRCENGTEDVKIGDLAYWPPGDAICVFFGRTPMSIDDRPVPASAVIIVGKIENPKILKKITNPKNIEIRQRK